MKAALGDNAKMFRGLAARYPEYSKAGLEVVEKRKVMLERVEQDFREAARPVEELLLEMDKIKSIEFPKNP